VFATQKESSDTEIAARFAPVFYQALGDKPRSDFITNFNFDADWRGDNNWNNAAKESLALKAYVYYAVSETATHFFIHYAVFHPRDYKGGEGKGTLLSELIREGVKLGGKYDPTGLADEATLAHENDMEGALVVVKKNGDDIAESQVVFVETLQHNIFARYQTGDPTPGFSTIKLEGARPLLYIEPKGHGIEAFVGDQKQTWRKDFLRYVSGGRADDPSKTDSVCRNLDTTSCSKAVSYELLSLETLWTKAKGEADSMYGVVFDYGEVTITAELNGNPSTEKKIKVGKRGCAFLGKVGGENMARPPWGWFERDKREQPLGQWFFDPATIIKRDFDLDAEFSTAYVRLPFWARS
jgi:hypothetical protein